MRVGQFSDALQRVYQSHRCQSAAFLTAANPGGVKISDTDNLQAEAKLQRDITSMRYTAFPGIGLDGDEKSDWPGERSLLVLGIVYQEAIRIGTSFDQLAIIWCDKDAVPQLLMLNTDTDLPNTNNEAVM
ncbi:DUF3293 domain-containing protein [Granulosicoccus antarcticus]|nr:DUF3293 domain-containing protein [Granulosicoccus antarcticus]